MRETFLPFSPPLIGEEEINEVVDTLRSDWITTGPKVKRLEKEFAEYVGAPAAAAFNSGTAALHVALLVLGIGKGDLVIVSPITFCSALNVIEHVGATPVLVDVEADTLNLDPKLVQECIERLESDAKTRGRLKAIMPVHLYGHPCDMDPLLALARKYKLAIVEDAAHAVPARYKGRMIGQHVESTVPVLTCFSFYATKNLTTAEGGMVTGPADLVDESRVWGLHGMSREAWKRYGAGGSWFYEVVHPGFKYNMTDLQAAIGLHQLRKLESFHARRAQIAAQYDAAFGEVRGLQIPTRRADVQHAWHLYVLRLDAEETGIGRDAFVDQLGARKIGTSVHFIPNHLHPFYRDKYGYKPEDFPVAYREYRRMLSLPLSPRLTDEDVQDVISAVREILHEARKDSAATAASGNRAAGSASLR